VSTEKPEIHMQGLPVSEGIVLAQVFLVPRFRNRLTPRVHVPPEARERELRRLQEAVEKSARHIKELEETVHKRLGPTYSKIFEAQYEMVRDPVLFEQIAALISDNCWSADTAVDQVFSQYEEALHAIEDEFLQARVTDVSEVKRRLLDVLRSDVSAPDPVASSVPANDKADYFIAVAEDLTPSDTVNLDSRAVAGFVTERGGRDSHVGILARALGIPAVTGVREVQKHLQNGDWILLNGTTGEVIVRPTSETLALYPTVKKTVSLRRRYYSPVEGVVVYANINYAQEVDTAAAFQPEGIGLYRTEYEFIRAGRILTEDEQVDLYRYVIEAMEGRPVYIRLADFGADKGADFLKIAEEENPCLGFRGTRLLLSRTELLFAQARAIVRAAEHYPVHVIYPMIIDLEQFLKAKQLFERAVADLPRRKIEHGVMLEVPSACLDAERLLQAADFATVGTNDLIQYFFAVDRNNELVAYDYTANKPIFWTLLRHIADVARHAQKRVSVCGEIAAQPEFIPKLLEMGFNHFSVSPRLIPLARVGARKFLRMQKASELGKT